MGFGDSKLEDTNPNIILSIYESILSLDKV